MPFGGPDGGDGGTGGGVWLVVDRNVSSLIAFKDHPHRAGESGTHGQGQRKHGRGGGDLEVSGARGHRACATSDGTVLADLVHPGERWLAAEGGRGGRGNARFLSNRRRAPAFAEQGEVGEERWLRLELKLMADVALVGFPSVGKSTLISTISAAKPKIADYPFTTLEPNLGVVRLDDETEFVVADLPGLIEGASEGRGLGHQFLRHVERARVLVLLLDLSPLAPHDPAEQERILLAELRRLRARPARAAAPRGRARAPTSPSPTSTSTATGSRRSPARGCGRSSGRWPRRSARPGRSCPKPDAFVVHRPVAEGYRIERDDSGAWTVVGRQAERAVALSDLTNAEALDEAHRRLRALGRRQGPRPRRRPRRRHRAHRPARLRLRGRPVIVVTKIGTSSITDRQRRDRRGRRGQVLRRGRRAPGPGPPGGARDLGGDRGRAAGAGLHGRRPTAGRRHPPGRLGRRPDPADARVRERPRHPRPGERPGAPRPARLHDPPAVPPRPRHARPPPRPRRRPGRQRERRHRRRRDPLRRQRPPGRARRPPPGRRPARAAHRRARAAHRRPAPRLVGVADRGDRRGRPLARVARRRHRVGPRERGHGVEAGRRQDRRVVGRAGGHRPGVTRRRARGGGRRTVRASGTVVHPKAQAPARPQALDRLRGRVERDDRRRRGRPRRRCSIAACRCSRPAWPA